MPYQNIDASLSAADVQAVKDALATIVQKLPFLVNLTPAERKSMFKTGPDRLSFVETAATAAESHPTIFPASFDGAGFLRDFELFKLMTELRMQIDSVASQIDDTCLAVGSESMQEATQVYKYIQAAVNTTPGLKPLADQLGEHFQRASKAKPDGEPKA